MLRNKKSVSVVVPVFNEETTLERVVGTLISCEMVDEVICIDDGSSDTSLHILKSFGDKIILIEHKENLGKGQAMVSGTEEATGDIILFLDADFTNLQCSHVNLLLEPLNKERIFASIGTLKKNGPRIILNEICGQRAYYKNDLTPLLKDMKNTRYGAEVFLNKKFKNEKVARVYLENIGHLNKQYKMKPFKATQEYIQEGIEITKELIPMDKINKEDMNIMKMFGEASDMKEVRKLLNKIKNRKLRHTLKKYFNKYIRGI